MDWQRYWLVILTDDCFPVGMSIVTPHGELGAGICAQAHMTLLTRPVASVVNWAPERN